MNLSNDLIKRFSIALPQIRGWIYSLLNDYTKQAFAVSTKGFKKLPNYFPEELLKHTKVVMVQHVPFPPVDLFNLPELAPVQNMHFIGITFKNTFFLQKDQISESLCFHELVHTIQLERLGVDNFLLAYGIGLIQFGYESSPLEEIAYGLQHDFDKGKTIPNLVHFVEMHSDKILMQVKTIL
jgi:hypothetical protein